MKERPIIFSAPMVRAILAGTKTQTRRVFKSPKRKDGAKLLPELLAKMGVGAACPYGLPGDRLWVKETWQYADWTEDGRPFIRYRADDAKAICERTPGDWAERLTDTWAELSDSKNFDIDERAADRRWRPSIFMPRWASRIDMEISEVRVERLQDITEEDARAEGIERVVRRSNTQHGGGKPGFRVHGEEYAGTARHAYELLWESINAKRGFGWARNPWVWCVSFKRTAP